ncbi:MAG TPA: methyl-accepting chemotaxis protein [Anaeromyxobacteraceae bacterium]|nr:methyl-accepting chemotaxis protein [Anaeromyxobacteraceae bacterium]
MTTTPTLFQEIRGRIFRRILATAVPSAVVAAYVFGLIMGLDGQALTKAILWILTPVLFLSAGQQFLVTSALTRRALEDRPDDAPGDRLKRLLELPRRVEIVSNVVAWLVGAVVFAGAAWLFFDRGVSMVWVGVVVGLFSSLFPGLILTMLVEDDLRPVALAEAARHPSAEPRGGGLFWPRQRWYLPYAFAVALVSLLVFSGIVVLTRWKSASTQLLAAIEAKGYGEAAEVVRHELDGLLVSAGVPVTIIALILLFAFLVTGGMLARRQARAAEAIEASLRALAAGNPERPGWIATDETGDLARAAARITGEMSHVFAQLRAMAAGDLSRSLQGDSGLIQAFRESQAAMVTLSQRMVALSRGEVGEQARIPGDLGERFDGLHRSFRAIVEQAGTIAAGDLRKDVEVPGALGESIQRMTGNLRGMVGQTQQTSSNLGEIVVSLQSAASQLSTATTEQVAAVTETANTMTEMAQTSAASADRASELIRRGEAAAEVVEEGGDTAGQAVQAMSNIAESLSRVSSSSSSLSERVKRIDDIVETVGFLADQSSTLAINAAIEASKAGEAGKGFAVVAREIRGLSGDSRKAARQIRELLGEIRDRTGLMDGAVVTGGRTVQEGQRLVEQLGQAIERLGTTLHEAVGLMRQVEGSARQHQAGVSQVSQALGNMQKASESIRDGARLLGDLSGRAHGLSEALQRTAGAYALPRADA